MAPDTLSPIVPALISAVTTGLVAYLTIRNAVGRFYREKWFDRKVEAYMDVIEALHHIQRQENADYEYMQEH